MGGINGISYPTGGYLYLERNFDKNRIREALPMSENWRLMTVYEMDG